MACLASKPVNPRSLNPYRKLKVLEYSVDEIERSYRVHKAAGRHIHQTITVDQVVHDA